MGSTFRARDAASLVTLTTPIAYITSYFPDPFADTQGITFRYYTDERGWILGSFGPDVDEAGGGDLYWTAVDDFDPDDKAANSVETAYDSQVAQPSDILLTAASDGQEGRNAFTYDPTNGTVSQGDVWRVKQ